MKILLRFNSVASLHGAVPGVGGHVFDAASHSGRAADDGGLGAAEVPPGGHLKTVG